MITLIGGATADTLIGGADNDSIIGNGGNDSLIGGAGNDIITGGQGNDTFQGGQGNDNIDGGDDVDTANYSQLAQTITLSGVGTVTKAGGFGQDTLFKVERVIANAAVANNTIDASQSLAGVFINVNLQTQSLAANNVPGLGTLSFTAVNFDDVIGTNANDIIVGDTQNNQLSGGAGDDNIHGGGGNDTVDGGTGNDTLSGDTGNDTFKGSQGNDSIDGGDGVDIADYSQLAQTITLSGVGTITKAGGLGQDTLFKVERVIANAAVANNTIDASQSVAGVSITVNLQTQSLTANNVPGLGTLSFTAVNFDNVIGTNGNDSIVGDTQNNQLSGGAGNDTLNGGSGIDTLTGGLGNDTYSVDNTADIVIEAVNSGIDTVRSSVTYSLSSNVENLTLTGTTATNGTGNSLNNFLFGNSFDNILNSGTGNDTLDGNFGNDILNAGDGNDSLQGGPGNDQLNGGAGNDILIGTFPNSPLPPGLGETDNLTGGTGIDKFILGDDLNAFYDDNNTTNPGFGDLATILDFDSSQDTIELKGAPKDYLLQTVGTNTRIFLDKPAPEQDEIIGIIQGRNNLRLDSDDFLFRERENAGQATNNTIATAEGLGSLSSGSIVNLSAKLVGDADYDFFEFSLASAGTVNITTATSGDTVLGLFNNIGGGSGTLLTFNDDNGVDLGSIITTPLSAGTYTISVSKYASFPQNDGTFLSATSSQADFSYQLGVTII